MKIGCDACGRAAAAVLCCADEAALCRRCDAAVHSANRLAGRHQRVELLSSSSTGAGAGEGDGTHPACDICQEKTGYFFCVEDRALLCRSCDVAVHTATAQASSHRRFLITGVRVGGSANAQQDRHIVSPSSSSANGSSSINVPPASSRTRGLADNDHLSAQTAARLLGVGGEDEEEAAAAGQQQWPWSDIFADDSGVGNGMDDRQFYNGLVSEPAGSSGLTG
ncbi:B-box zinc finger protein 23 [Brachypodium distachyon]|uniref:B box-type domain-containing protein n=1 Tax=Brachypodium distachyon TaxID=15368 RepID=I1ITL5_BRADI|nr:B-box zinc finger protein 23 [Brachypodium distachyon]KQJ91873.1 hypothetical protein BRADI_4g40250v3 [Brachypodium distachyon]|eukprot:XP_003576960.1 B-box zinc finger protein 23 [Brachypodium distachyon]